MYKKRERGRCAKGESLKEMCTKIPVQMEDVKRERCTKRKRESVYVVQREKGRYTKRETYKERERERVREREMYKNMY